MTKKKVVVLGGGNGSAVSLVALKQNIAKFEIVGIVAMSDSGGSSGKLRKEFGVLPPGDIMRAVLALSKYDYLLLKKIFYTNRFDSKDKLNKHNLGNIFLTLATRYGGELMSAVQALGQSVEMQGKVFPATLFSSDLVAELTNGKKVFSEYKIDQPEYDRSIKIKKVFLEPKVKAYSEATKAIKSADYIILSPGSLYTSVIATLLPSGMQEAIKNSRAKIIFVSGNAYRTDSETGPEDVVGAVQALQQYLPRKIDLVLHNNCHLTAADKKKYKEKKWGELLDNSKELKEYKVVSFDYERDGGGLCSIKLGKKLKEVLN
ncbi:MAG: YvcK family protein [Candidatus Magasanikbacteria bacterium]|nr:YvcK family protein [Candidatus Magasanikbacteria bacterium]